MHITDWQFLASLVAEARVQRIRARMEGGGVQETTTCAAEVVSLPVMNPLMQLSVVVRMLGDMVDPGVLLQQALGEQPRQVTPGGRPSGPLLLLLKCPLICEPITPLHNLRPENSLLVHAQALV